MSKIMREVVEGRSGGDIVMSHLEEVTEQEIALARSHYATTGQCDHSLVTDEKAWLYDLRECAVCGVGLGAI